MRRLLFLLIPLALVVGACGGGNDDGSTAMHDDGMSGMDMHGDRENGDVADDARTIQVEAKSFSFGPDRIEVDAGEHIAIELTSDDVEHDFVIDGDGDGHVVHVAAGNTETGGFTAPDEPGRYTFYCSVSGHRAAGMEGTLVVS